MNWRQKMGRVKSYYWDELMLRNAVDEGYVDETTTVDDIHEMMNSQGVDMPSKLEMKDDQRN
jgi:hypothetical protein